MPIRLKAQTERAIQQELANGSYNSADELILHALSLLRHLAGRGEHSSIVDDSNNQHSAHQTVDQDSAIEALFERLARLPVLDRRSPDEIIG